MTVALGQNLSPAPERDDTSVSVLKNVHLRFGDHQILKGFSLELKPGSKVALMGESSCGKSTVLKTMVGLVPPNSGEVYLFGRDLAALGNRARAALRRHIGMQFQAGALFDSSSVFLNLQLASEESSRGDMDRKPATKDEILEMLSQVGLKEAAGRIPASLSGGMRKRAALARALIAEPKLAIFDEPTAGLDPQTSSLIINLLNSLAEKREAAMILATADPEVARRFSDDIVLIKDGLVYTRGSMAQMESLGDPYIDKFLYRLREVRA
ncbi:MAG: ATP-binding cassette domain-containing protein [Deltaproteobacteria bacterium]|jgi:phospholipid/cholesterol/gamma-HCH transport system ATP-binding protein|nr:ATP-binding cassette domain-containing protein [Deltaproteobacteria bacterium]